jgi:hypothetical protein
LLNRRRLTPLLGQQEFALHSLEVPRRIALLVQAIE